MFKYNGEYVVDLEDDHDHVADGYVIDTHDNQYHGWNGGNGCVRYAVCVPVDEEGGARQ